MYTVKVINTSVNGCSLDACTPSFSVECPRVEPLRSFLSARSVSLFLAVGLEVRCIGYKTKSRHECNV